MPKAEWTAVIADDEPAARRGVRQLLAAYPEFTVAAECRDGAETLVAIESLKPDVVFLDIQMPGIDGFEVIRRRTPERMPAVIFLTAYDQFAIRAFEAQALDYLLKPVSQARFAATIKRLVRQLRSATPALPEQAIAVTTARGVTVVPLHEIDWIEAADNYARIWTGTRSHLLRESLRELEERVQSHGFLRAHRCAIVRLRGIRKLAASDTGEMVAVLTSGARVPVSRRRRAAFVDAVRSQSSHS